MGSMSVVQHWRVEPKSIPAFIEAVTAFKPIAESHGGVLGVSQEVAGPNAGCWCLMIRFESSAKFGASFDEQAADPKWTDWVTKHFIGGSGNTHLESARIFRAADWI